MVHDSSSINSSPYKTKTLTIKNKYSNEYWTKKIASGFFKGPFYYYIDSLWLKTVVNA